MTRLHLIFARSRNGVIGRDGALPWHLPQDLAHFKRTTLGAPVIMGRRTWDSIPARFRPLAGRLNIVLTRQAGWRPEGAGGQVACAASLAAALARCGDAADAWVIGGAALFEAALPLCDSAVVTEIDADFDGDVRAPAFGPDWLEVERTSFADVAAWPFSIQTWRRG